MTSVSELIGRGVYKTVRKAAKIPFDINHHLFRGDAPEVLNKSCYDRLEGELGSDMYKELCQDTALVLETVYYCQEELSLVGISLQAARKLLISDFDETEQKKRLFNHDFLILKIQPGKQDEPAFHIKAEKLAGGDDGKLKPGIHISQLDEEIEPIQNTVRSFCLHRIECGSHVGLGDLIAILKKKNPDYHARDENCWDYARKTTKWLLEACLQATSDEREKYKRALEHLEANLVKKRAVNTAGRMVKYAKTHVWEKLKS